MANSTPLIAVIVTNEGLTSKLYGCVDSATRAIGLVFSATQGTPSISSNLRVPIVEVSNFFREAVADLPVEQREEIELSYGNTALSMVLPSGTRLTVFFTSP